MCSSRHGGRSAGQPGTGASPSWETCPFSWLRTAPMCGPTGNISSWTGTAILRKWPGCPRIISAPRARCGGIPCTGGMPWLRTAGAGGRNGSGYWAKKRTGCGSTISGALRLCGRCLQEPGMPVRAGGNRVPALPCSMQWNRRCRTWDLWPKTWGSSPGR